MERRNKENEGKKRPICACGDEMTYFKHKGYYDEVEGWMCDNEKCTTEDEFYKTPDVETKGCYA